MSDNTIKKISQDFSHYFINEDDVVVNEGRIMLTPLLEIGEGSLDVEGAVEIL